MRVKHPSIKRIGSQRPNGNAPEAGQPENLVTPAAGRRQSAITPTEAPALRILPPVSLPVALPRKPHATSTRRERVLVMDGHPMVEEWIGALLGREADLVFAGHAADLGEAATLVARGRPSLVLLEIAMDVPRGLEIVSALKAKFPKLRILVFSSCDERAHSVPALRAGAHGFVSKAACGPDLLLAIRQVLHDGVYLSSAMIGHLAAGAPEPTPATATGPGALLSQRDLQVFVFIGEGLHPKEIAQRISVSVKTVESYLARIREKLVLKDSRELFKEAVRWCKVRDVETRK